ncbi:phosphoribosyltransferase [Salinisphaera sp. T31B1]
MLLGTSCALCRAPADLDRNLCHDCATELPWLVHACHHCGMPLTPTASSTTCRDCRQRPRFDHVVPGFVYEQPIRWMIARLKFDGQLTYARLLGDLLAAHIRERLDEHGDVLPEQLIPVPLHRSGYRQRGFNQAERLARRLGGQLACPVEPRMVERGRATERQSTLAAERRAANMRDAFVCRGTLRARHVAIVDDVMTTGHTVAALDRCLRAAGATRVDIYCVARA